MYLDFQEVKKLRLLKLLKGRMMLRFFLVSIFCFSLVFGFSQKESKYTIYEMGRPNKFEHNNAVRNVQEKWQIDFVSSSASGVYGVGLDSLINENAKTDSLLKVKYGNTWNADFHKDVSEMAKKHNKVRELLFKESSSFKSMYIEVMVKNKRIAKVKIFKSELNDGELKYMTLYKYKVKLKKSKLKLISDEKELIDFEYPQNNISNR